MKILRIASKAAVLAVFIGLISRHARAQDNPAQAATNPPDSTSASASAPTAGPFFSQLLQQKLPVEFGFRIGQSHSDNIYFQPRKTSDYITEISPSLDYILGQRIRLAPQLDLESSDDAAGAGEINYLQLSYRPTLNLYATNSSLDDVDEYANAVYTHQFSRLTLSIAQTYEKLSSPRPGQRPRDSNPSRYLHDGRECQLRLFGPAVDVWDFDPNDEQLSFQ
jgi:hypothetical protein